MLNAEYKKVIALLSRPDLSGYLGIHLLLKLLFYKVHFWNLNILIVNQPFVRRIVSVVVI